MEFPSFIGPTYEAQSYVADQERTVNWYPERLESPGASARAELVPTPGVNLLSTASSGVGRGHIYINGREFAVIGSGFYEIASTGLLTSRGTVALDSNPATISSNGDGGDQLFITSGGNGYVYDLNTNVLTQIAALNGKATMGDHLDGFFLALDANTSTLQISNLLNGATWQASQIAQRSAAPDRWVAMKVAGPYIWLLGTETSEVWYNAGTSPFPFAKHPSGLIPYGIAAPWSISLMGREIAWLGASRNGQANVLRAAGFTPEVISSYALLAIIHGYISVDDAQADSYMYLGHSFYCLSFPHQRTTHVWDAETRLWCDRGTWIAEESRYIEWRPRWHVVAFGEHRTLDSTSGAVYRLTPNSVTDVESRPMRRLRRSPSLMGENQRIFYPGFELDLDTSPGAATGQASNPQLMLRISNDGGKTWGAEMMRSAGKIGEYARRVRWDRCGSARRRVWEVSFTDPLGCRLVGASLTPDPIRANGQRAGS